MLNEHSALETHADILKKAFFTRGWGILLCSPLCSEIPWPHTYLGRGKFQSLLHIVVRVPKDV